MWSLIEANYAASQQVMQSERIPVLPVSFLYTSVF